MDESAYEGQGAYRPEEMHGSSGKPCEEEYGDEVEEATDEAFETELGVAVLAGMMMDRLLSDPFEALPAREHGHMPM